MAYIGKLNQGSLFVGGSTDNQQLLAGAIGSSMTIDETGALVWSQSGTTSDIVIIEDDFIYYSSTGQIIWPWSPQSNGTGASSLISVSTAANPGIHTLNTGTTSGGEAYIARGNADGGGIENCVLGGAVHDLTFIVNIPSLATVGDDYALYFGLADGFGNFVSHPGNNAVVFAYNRSVSVNWQGLTKAGGSTTTASGGANIAVATGWNRFRISINAAGTSASFYVNGVLIGTSATNLPTAPISAGFNIKKSAGTTPCTLQIDYFRWFQKLTTSRF